MTIKELIKELERFDGDLLVIYATQENNYDPSPSLQNYDFDTDYYNGYKYITIPKNTNFVQL